MGGRQYEQKRQMGWSSERIMLLAEAAIISEKLREMYRNYMTDSENRSLYWEEALTVIKQMMDDGQDDLQNLIDIFFPKYSRYQRQFSSVREIRDDMCKKLSISPLVWDEVLAGKPIVPLLALESPEYGGEGMTVKQALHLMTRIKDEGFLKIASKMHEKEALLFWSRALDERPPIPVDRFLQLISYLSANRQSLQSVRRMLETRHPAEIAGKLFADERVEIEVRTMQPGQAFKGPIYRAWDKLIAPSDIYAEVIGAPRRYLHVTEFPKGKFKGILYNRDKQIIGKVSQVPYTSSEAIFEVEADINQVKCITDVMAIGDDWDIYKLKYRERASYLSKLELTCPIKTGVPVSANEDVSHLLETLEDNERLRLTLSGPFSIGGEGGWVLLKDAFHVHLLVTDIMKDEGFETHVRLASMDGYETYVVGEQQLPVGMAQHIRQRLASQGVLVGNNWLPVDEYAVVVMAEINEFSITDMTAKKITLEYIDDNAGYGEVCQLTDLIEMAH